ncbi:SpoVR family protein [Terasakiella sp.]|uniref:SpoVR family protein n=1 Tax=Terasakiella sp. TaxID=2034861 RepID=UPI003AA95BE3
MIEEKTKPLFERSEWTFDTMSEVYDAIEEIAHNELHLDTYPNQIEVISSEQMLDAYSSIGLPLMYRHWSFGKRFARDEHSYRRGYSGLAYEIVINSSPCISYNMEDNSMAMQTLVMAHAAFGHNHFFKNNYLFKQWTDAEGILEYLSFARDYITKCEERYGIERVEEILDAAHALMDQGVFRYRRPPKLSKEALRKKVQEREEYEERSYNDLWRTVPAASEAVAELDECEVEQKRRQEMFKLPEENLLYFLEKNSPNLRTWEREVLRIVRNIAQYFYPQKQTKVMNEGCATFVHYTIMNRLYDKGLISEGALLEMLHSHTSVVFQPDFDDPRYSGINPYALGFNMMTDIKRICMEPTEEDRDWFPAIAGNGEWRDTLLDAWANYRDESFILQYLSPYLMRKMRLFSIGDDSKSPTLEVGAIHNKSGYRQVRNALAESYNLSLQEPDIQVVDVNIRGDRTLFLRHRCKNRITLHEQTRNEVLKHLKLLWGYHVVLTGIEQETNEELYCATTRPQKEESGF